MREEYRVVVFSKNQHLSQLCKAENAYTAVVEVLSANFESEEDYYKIVVFKESEYERYSEYCVE